MKTRALMAVALAALLPLVGCSGSSKSGGEGGRGGGSGNATGAEGGAAGGASGGVPSGAGGTGGGSGAAGAAGDDSAGATGAASGAGGSDVGQAGAGAGGSGGMAGNGTAGSAGDGCTPNVLEDIEDGVIWSPTGQYALDWVTWSDETASVSVEPIMQTHPAGGSFSVSCQGGPFTDWGGGCILHLVDVPNTGGPLDARAHAFEGIEFWALANQEIALRVNLPDGNSLPAGGTCSMASDCNGDCCYDHYGATVTVGTSWTRHRILFDALEREDNNGPPAAFSDDAIYEIDFRLPVALEVELSIDDVALVSCP